MKLILLLLHYDSCIVISVVVWNTLFVQTSIFSVYKLPDLCLCLYVCFVLMHLAMIYQMFF